jgi:hypothetical protein
MQRHVLKVGIPLEYARDLEAIWTGRIRRQTHGSAGTRYVGEAEPGGSRHISGRRCPVSVRKRAAWGLAGHVDLDQDVVLAQLRVWHIADPHAVGVSVTIEDECPHRWSLSSPSPETCVAQRVVRQRPGPLQPAARVPSDPRRRPGPCPDSSCRGRSLRCLQ